MLLWLLKFSLLFFGLQPNEISINPDVRPSEELRLLHIVGSVIENDENGHELLIASNDLGWFYIRERNDFLKALIWYEQGNGFTESLGKEQLQNKAIEAILAYKFGYTDVAIRTLDSLEKYLASVQDESNLAELYLVKSEIAYDLQNWKEMRLRLKSAHNIINKNHSFFPAKYHYLKAVYDLHNNPEKENILQKKPFHLSEKHIIFWHKLLLAYAFQSNDRILWEKTNEEIKAEKSWEYSYEIRSKIALLEGKILSVDGNQVEAKNRIDLAYSLATRSRNRFLVQFIQNQVREIDEGGFLFQEENFRVYGKRKNQYFPGSSEELCKKLINDEDVQDLKTAEMYFIENAYLKSVQSKTQKYLYIALIVGLLLLVSYLTYIIYNRKKVNSLKHSIQENTIRNLELNQEKVKLESFIAGQEKEKGYLGKEIHDSLGGLLSTTKILMSKEGIDHPHIVKLIDDACSEIRQITQRISPGVLSTMGLEAALEDLVEIANQVIVSTNLEYRVNKFISEEKTLHLYRIVQELVTNALKHSQAEELIIQVLSDNSGVNILVEDNGVGFETTKLKKENNGIVNIQARCQLLKATLNVESVIEEGTSVQIFVPL